MLRVFIEKLSKLVLKSLLQRCLRLSNISKLLPSIRSQCSFSIVQKSIHRNHERQAAENADGCRTTQSAYQGLWLIEEKSQRGRWDSGETIHVLGTDCVLGTLLEVDSYAVSYLMYSLEQPYEINILNFQTRKPRFRMLK